MGSVLLFMNSLRTCQFLCCLKHPADTLSFKHMAWFKVERNYIAIEKYMSRCDEVFELIAYQPFESADDALVHLNAVCNGAQFSSNFFRNRDMDAYYLEQHMH